MMKFCESIVRIKKFSSLSLTLKGQYLLFYFFSALYGIKFQVFHWYNLVRLNLSSVSYGNGLTTMGIMVVNIFPGSKVTFGKNVSIISDSRRATASALAFPTRLKTFTPDSKIIIGDNVGLNGTSITSRSKVIEIDSGSIIAPNVIIVDSDFHRPWPPEKRLDYPGDENDSDVKIGKNCWIGMNSIILKGVHIGENSIIAAGSVVVNDIPPDSLAAGVPAKVVKSYR